MRKLIRHAIATAAATTLLAGIALAAEPTKVTNDAFSITLPGGFTAFTSQTKTADSKDGKVETTNWVAKSDAGQAVIVAMTKMPAKILAPQKMMDSTRDALLKSLNATIETETKIAGDIPAESLLFKNSGVSPVFVRGEFLVSVDKLYQILYVARSEQQRSDPAVAAMFDSFKATSQVAQAGQPPK